MPDEDTGSFNVESGAAASSQATASTSVVPQEVFQIE